MRIVDLMVICLYLAALPVISLKLAHRAGNASGFLGAERDLPWWAICLSLVATETSTLTVISVPGVAYTNGMVFVGLAAGYLVGRGIVAMWFLPRYARGTMTSAYQYLGRRFGPGLQRVASLTFLFTRLLAESVRLLAGLLPLVWLLKTIGLPVDRTAILCAVMGFTLVYTLFGGLRAVVCSDAIQLGIYLLGAAICALLLMLRTTPAQWHHILDAGRLLPFHVARTAAFSDPFTICAAVLGGAVLSMASHGTDQLMVQRLLAARSLRAARAALIGSAVLVGVLFGLLSLIGVLLWGQAGGASVTALGMQTPDELFPRFIVTALPAGLSGLLIAGVLAASMGSLSSTLNAMAGVVLTDFGPLPTRGLAAIMTATRWPTHPLAAPRLAILLCALMLMAAMELLGQGRGSAVILALTLTGWSYGPMLGAFLFGMMCPAARERDALVGLCAALAAMAACMFVLHREGRDVAFSWLVPLGTLLMIVPAWMSARLSGGKAEDKGAISARKTM